MIRASAEKQFAIVFMAVLTLMLSGRVAPGFAQAYGAKPPPAQKLIITGSSTMAPLVTEMARRFEALHPAIKVGVGSGGSGKGISDLRAESSSIAMVSRVLLDAEKDLFAVPIARDGVALIVHRDNPVKGLRAQQALAIITGKIGNWKSVGGRDAPIMLIWRSLGQGSGELVADKIQFSYADVRAQAIVVENEALIREVGRNPNAIAPVSLGSSESELRAGAHIRMLPFDGVAPSTKAVNNGSYGLSRPLMLVTRRLPQGAAKRFIDFALSGHVADLFTKHDFIAYQD